MGACRARGQEQGFTSYPMAVMLFCRTCLAIPLEGDWFPGLLLLQLVSRERPTFPCSVVPSMQDRETVIAVIMITTMVMGMITTIK